MPPHSRGPIVVNVINPRAEHSPSLTSSQHLPDLADERLSRERLFEEGGAVVGNRGFEARVVGVQR